MKPIYGKLREILKKHAEYKPDKTVFKIKKVKKKQERGQPNG